jgi:hypothetical protein
MTSSTTRTWRIPIALVVSSLVPMVGGLARLDALASGGPVTQADARFVASPAPIVLHVVAATIYSLVGAFQFSAGLRRRWPTWHRRAGRVLVVLGLLSALSGVWMALAWNVPVAMQGPVLMVVRVFVGVAMTAALVLGVRAILRRDVPNHEAWMIRAYALGQGAGAQVLWLGVPSIFAGELLGLQRDISMTLAWLGNAMLGEWVIRRRYVPAQPRTIAAAASSTGSRARLAR